MDTLPCLIDSNGLVMSLAPVTNSDTTKVCTNVCFANLSVALGIDNLSLGRSFL